MQISFDFLGFVGRQQANRLLTRTCERRHACDTQTTSIRRTSNGGENRIRPVSA